MPILLPSDNTFRFYLTSKLSIWSYSAVWLCSRPLKDEDPWKSGKECGRGICDVKGITHLHHTNFTALITKFVDETLQNLVVLQIDS